MYMTATPPLLTSSFNLSKNNVKKLSNSELKAILRIKYIVFTISLSVISTWVLFNIVYFEFIPVYGTMDGNMLEGSPSFSIEEIIDPDLDWINMTSRNQTKEGDRSTDIEAVDYYSDGRTLNAILWLYHPFQTNQSYLNEETDYGMFIDADFDEATGFGGIEYKYEIGWDNKSKQWTKILEKWSHFGDPIVLENQSIQYTNYSKKDAHYVVLSLDLGSILSPSKYKVVFYGDTRRGGHSVADFTRLIAMPPLELTVSTSPKFLELIKGEPKTIEVRVNTSQGYEPIVNLNAKSQSEGIILDFTQNDTLIVPSYTFRIPSYGIATIPLTIRTTENANIGPNSIFIFANSSFPPEEFIEMSTNFLPESAKLSENIFTQASLLIALKAPLTILDHVGNFWDKVGAPISFVVGIIIGHIAPWVFNKTREGSKKQENSSS